MKTLGKLSRLLLGGICALAGAGLVQACGSDPVDPGDGTSAGNAGAGKGAASGRGGSAGAAGQSGGQGGSSAGRGGAGGNACIPEPEEDPLAHCPQRTGQQPTSACPFEQTCVALRCGQPGSQFDESGCRREECRNDRDCGDDERCLPPPLQGIFELCYSSVYEAVVNECDACLVGASADCTTPAFCEPRAQHPVADDCDISGLGCNGLFLAQASVLGYLEQWEDAEDADLLEALTRCHDRIRDAREACYPDGEGGAGGEAGANGAAGASGEGGAGAGNGGATGGEPDAGGAGGESARGGEAGR